MANIELRFIDGSDSSFITCKQINTDVYITIVDANGDANSVFLDKSTAIKLAKTIRTEINKIV